VYLTSLHPPGAVLWGGKGWKKLKRFRHPNIQLVAFSPNEKFMVTYSNIPPEKDSVEDPQAIAVWDVITGQRLRGFAAIEVEGKPLWPAFQWSPDEKFFSRVKDGLLYVYEAPSMNLLEVQLNSFPFHLALSKVLRALLMLGWIYKGCNSAACNKQWVCYRRLLFHIICKRHVLTALYSSLSLSSEKACPPQRPREGPPLVAHGPLLRRLHPREQPDPRQGDHHGVPLSEGHCADHALQRHRCTHSIDRHPILCSHFSEDPFIL